MDKLTTLLSSKKFEVAAFLLLVGLILISTPYPGVLDVERDYRWLAARAFGQSESIWHLLAQHGDLYDYNIDVSYDTLSFSQHPLNPFFLLAYFTNPFLGNYFAIMFMSAISFIYCRRIAEQANLLTIFPVLAAAFFLSQSFDHHFSSNLCLNSLFAIPVYYVITCKFLQSQKLNLLDWSVIILGPLIMDLHGPLVLAFTVLFTTALRFRTIDFSNWTYKNTLILIAVLAIHAFGWLPWLESSSQRPEVTLEKLLNFKNIFVFGPHNLNELLLENDGYLGVLFPKIGSGTFFYMPIGFIMVSFWLMIRNRTHVFARCLYGFSVAMILFAFFIGSQYVYDILQPLSYFRYPLNLIPPLIMVASLAALYNTRPSTWLFVAYLLAFVVDYRMPYRAMNDPYIFVHYVLGGIVLWLGYIRHKRSLPIGAIPLVAVIYSVVMIFTIVIPNAYKFSEVAPYKSTFIPKSMAAMQCIQDATGKKPFTSILYTGVSDNDPGKGRLHSADTSYFVEDSRGFGLTTFFLQREFLDQSQIDAQFALFDWTDFVKNTNGTQYPWTGRGIMPPEIGKLPAVEYLHTAGIQYLGMIGKDWQSQDWWKKNKKFFTFKASCQLLFDKMEIYALNPQKSDYTLMRNIAQTWHVDAEKDTTVTVPIANRPTTHVYVNGLKTPAIDASGPIKVNVAKGASEITIKNTNFKHILAYLYFWLAMISVTGSGLFGLKRIWRETR